MTTINLWLLIIALATVETGNRNLISRTGDIGPLQMSVAARMDGLSPPDRLQWLAGELSRHGLPVSVYTLAAAWRSPQRIFRRKLTDADCDYANRVRNIYQTLLPNKTPKQTSPWPTD